MIAAVEFDQVSKIYSAYLPKQKVDLAKNFDYRKTRSVYHSKFNDYKPLVVLDSVTFTVCQSEIFAIVGPSGSGKSIILRLLAARILPDKGKLKIFGCDASRLPEVIRNQVNFFSYEGSFFRNLSPIENLLFIARERRIADSAFCGKINETFDRLGISHKDQHTPLHLLSPVTQTLVSIVSSIYSFPRMLLLDEPVSKLSMERSQIVFDAFKDLRDQHGTTIVIATRYLDRVLSICDRWITLESGRIRTIDHASPLSSCTLTENVGFGSKEPVAT